MRYLYLVKINEEDGSMLFPYDKASGFVVCTEHEADARGYCAEACGDEGEEPWTDPKRSTCVRIGVAFEPSDAIAGVVLCDSLAG